MAGNIRNSVVIVNIKHINLVRCFIRLLTATLWDASCLPSLHVPVDPRIAP
jgi:hypothetical protein